MRFGLALGGVPVGYPYPGLLGSPQAEFSGPGWPGHSLAAVTRSRAVRRRTLDLATVAPDLEPQAQIVGAQDLVAIEVRTTDRVPRPEVREPDGHVVGTEATVPVQVQVRDPDAAEVDAVRVDLGTGPHAVEAAGLAAADDRETHHAIGVGDRGDAMRRAARAHTGLELVRRESRGRAVQDAELDRLPGIGRVREIARHDR